MIIVQQNRFLTSSKMATIGGRLLLALLLLLSMSTAVQAAPSCSNIFLDSTPNNESLWSHWQNSQQWLKQLLLEKLGKAPRSVNIEDQFEVVDQCEFKTCSIHSLISQLEQVQYNQTKDRITLSRDYVISSIAKERFAEALTEVIRNPLAEKTPDILLSSNTTEVLNSISDFGLIPERDWAPPVTRPANFKELYLVTKLRTLLFKSRPLLSSGQLDQAEVFHQANEIIAEFFGKPRNSSNAGINGISDSPTEPVVSDEGQWTTPLQFLQQRFSFARLKNSRTYILSYEGNNDLTMQTDGHWEQNVEPQFLIKKIEKYLASGQNLIAHLALNSAKVDQKTGWITPRDSREDRDQEIRDHAILIAGITLSGDKQIEVIKLKNSWGQKVGDKGFFYLRTKDFPGILKSVTAFDTSGIH